MNKRDKNFFRSVLLDERNKLLHHLHGVQSSVNQYFDESRVHADYVDNAFFEVHSQSLQWVGSREQKYLAKVNRALHKIDIGTYGECDSCGEDIAKKRLHARPVAELCIDCKTEEEHSERRFNHGKTSEVNRQDESEDSELFT